MQYKPGVVLETHCDPLPESPRPEHALVAAGLRPGLNCRQEQGAHDSPGLKRLSAGPRLERFEVDDDARYLRQWLVPGA